MRGRTHASRLLSHARRALRNRLGSLLDSVRTSSHRVRAADRLFLPEFGDEGADRGGPRDRDCERVEKSEEWSARVRGRVKMGESTLRTFPIPSPLHLVDDASVRSEMRWGCVDEDEASERRASGARWTSVRSVSIVLGV